MIFSNIEEFRKKFENKGRLLGLDIGDKTIGIAISDPDWKIASAIETIQRSQWKKDGAYLLELAAGRQAEALVVGWPLNMDGSEGKRCQSTRHIVHNILKLKDFPILLWDERLSSWAVDQMMIDADISRKKRAQSIDKLAAAYILQGALDRLTALAFIGLPPE